MKWLLALLLFVCWPAFAVPMFNGTDHLDRPMSLKLSDEPCNDPKMAGAMAREVNPSYMDKFKAATLFYGGQNWASCWIELGGVIYSIDEEGVQMNGGRGIPKHLFKDNTI